MAKYILAIDQGTTGTTVSLFEEDTLLLKEKINQELPQKFPQASWVEHNLQDIWATIEKCSIEIFKLHKVSPSDISCIGVTNQRETTCAFSKSGRPLYNAIVWQDRRTSPYCDQIKQKGLEEKIRQITGLRADPYFSGTKMKWLLENIQAVKEHAKRKDLCLGTIDTFLLHKLTNGASFKTDITNASRTLLMDLSTGQWSKELLDIFEIQEDFLPQIQDSIGLFGKTKNVGFLPDGIPITGILGDQQSALFGHMGHNPGSMKCTYGTGAFILLNTGKTIKRSQSGLLSTVAFGHKGEIHYALEGSSYIAGAAVQWFRDQAKGVSSAKEIEELAKSISNYNETKNLIFFPFLSGIGSPHWVPDAKGAILGLSRDTGLPQLAQAILEGIAFSINDLIVAFSKDSGLEVSELLVDGGASENDHLMSLQSTISNLNILRPQNIETTSLGAALAAKIGIEDYFPENKNKANNHTTKFTPSHEFSDYIAHKQTTWDKYIKKIFF